MYRKSRIVAAVGIPVVVVVVILVALSADPTDPNPKGALAIIFGAIGALVFGLLIVQGRELGAASRARSSPLTAPGTAVENPMTIPPVDLWAALAIGPIGDEAARAHDEVWGTVRSSRRSLWIVCVLIIVCVPMTYLLETFVPVLVGAALIGAVAIVAAIRVVGSGGGLDRGYEALDRSLVPLGLQLDERPTVGAKLRTPPAPGLKTDIRGALRFSGERHGRAIGVVMDGGANEVRVAVDSPSFAARSSDGKLKAKKGTSLPAGIEAALRSVPGSIAWKGVTVAGGGEGIVVRRKPVGEQGWMPDLWLAERLASAAEIPDRS